MPTSTQPKRLYAVEFLRIWFILCIIVFHALAVVNQGELLKPLQSSGVVLYNAVVFFFVIGGFFLYRRITQNTGNAYGLIKTIYLRLLPVTLFALAIVVSLKPWILPHLPISIAQLNGTGLFKSSVLGWGDWFIGAYFWTSCLFIAIFQKKSRWLWLGLLIYASLIMDLRGHLVAEGKVNSLMLLYFGIVPRCFTYAISCMGIGMIGAFVADKCTHTFKWPFRIVITCFEILCLVYIYKYLFDAKHALGAFETMFIMGAFMISVAHSWGYISAFFNKLNWVQYASRYSLPALFGHIISLHILTRYRFFGWSDLYCYIFVIGGGILLGVIEYHIVEKWLVSKIKAYLRA